ncbi:hypothetical protein D3C72_968420 [compost metagenome]
MGSLCGGRRAIAAAPSRVATPSASRVIAQTVAWLMSAGMVTMRTEALPSAPVRPGAEISPLGVVTNRSAPANGVPSGPTTEVDSSKYVLPVMSG